MSPCPDTSWETGIILTPSFQTKSKEAIKRQSNIFKCQAHQYEARRRWKSVCARGSIIERSSGMDFLNAVDTVPFNTQPWPEYLNRKASIIRYFILAPSLTCSSVLDLTAHTDTNVT